MHTNPFPPIIITKNKLYFQVNLYRNITFRNSLQTYNGIPVMASNMDTVGTFEMAKTLSKVIIISLLYTVIKCVLLTVIIVFCNSWQDSVSIFHASHYLKNDLKNVRMHLRFKTFIQISQH